MTRFLLSLLLLFGCTQNEDKELTAFMSNNKKMKVLSTTGIIDDLVGEIGGEYIDHIVLIRGELDPHSYELVKGDDEKLARATIIFYNGLGLEHGASLHYRLQDHPNAFALGEIIVESSPEDLVKVDQKVDPHIWMDVAFFARVVEPIVEGLSRSDPAHAAFFKANGEQLLEKMLFVDATIAQMIAQIPEKKRYLVTSHDAFNYFARRYLVDSIEEKWENRVAAPEGLSPEGQLSSMHIADIIAHLAHYQIGVVFPESNVNRDSLKKIVTASREKGIEVKISSEVLYGDAKGGEGSGASSYLQMMEHNAKVLVKEWNE